jgi:hypothetical protein
MVAAAVAGLRLLRCSMSTGGQIHPGVEELARSELVAYPTEAGGYSVMPTVM